MRIYFAFFLIGAVVQESIRCFQRNHLYPGKGQGGKDKKEDDPGEYKFIVNTGMIEVLRVYCFEFWVLGFALRKSGILDRDVS